ncbi:hypothetical protein OsI_38885 [Oryza sativa Indica Group]|uniref:Uncharacterized protein n=1 Tax=Oryza sativa subsp. indica TaxID=39946 RepID=B8BMQ5_ORYSI|nr:hypothetical protein OsI_38885 [Oryza sativa Indica Group]
MMRMDKLVRQCDMEVMKMAMLKHEETFRQQVHELHRLYRIQRQLMSDLTMAELSSGHRRRQPRRSSKQPRRALNLQLPADEYIVNADAADDNDDTAELDLTLAVGGGRSSRKCNAAIAAAAAAAAGGSSPFASDCSGSGLSSSPSSAEYSDGAAMFLHAPPPMPPPCQRAMAFDLAMGDAMKQQQSPWLVQCQYLSLRMT